MVGIAWTWLVHTGVPTSTCSLHAVCASRWVKCLEKRVSCSPRQLVKPTTRSNTDGHVLHGTINKCIYLKLHASVVIMAYVIVYVFSRRVATREVWMPELLVRICCIASSITSAYIKNKTMWNSLTIPWRFARLLRSTRHVKCHSYHACTSVTVSGGGRNATVHDPKPDT